MKTGSAGRTLLSQMQEQLVTSKLRGQNRAVFLRMRDEIAETVAAGYTVKSIWEFLRSTRGLEMAYETFRVHCKAAGIHRVPKASRFAAPASPAIPPPPITPKRFTYASVPNEKALYGDQD